LLNHRPTFHIFLPAADRHAPRSLKAGPARHSRILFAHFFNGFSCPLLPSADCDAP
jgi:hypothetical protein